MGVLAWGIYSGFTRVTVLEQIKAEASLIKIVASENTQYSFLSFYLFIFVLFSIKKFPKLRNVVDKMNNWVENRTGLSDSHVYLLLVPFFISIGLIIDQYQKNLDQLEKHGYKECEILRHRPGFFEKDYAKGIECPETLEEYFEMHDLRRKFIQRKLDKR